MKCFRHRNEPGDAQTQEFPNRPVAGSLLVLGSGLVFAAMSALVKLLIASLSTEMVVFFRNAIALVILLPWLFVRHGWSVIPTGRIGMHLLRTAAGLGAMYCIFFSLSRMKLGEVILLSYTSPLFIPLIAHWWLKEPITRPIRLAVAIGFLGVALILKPGYGMFQPVALVGLTAGILMALAMVTIRAMSTSEPAVRIVFYFSLFSTVLSGIPVSWGWQSAPLEIWLMLAAMGLLAVFGQIMLTRGYSLAPAARIGPFSYGNVLFSTLFGWLFWSETLDLLTWVGAICIFLAGILTSYRRGTVPAAPGVLHHHPTASTRSGTPV